MQSKAATVAAYLKSLPDDRRKALQAIRKVVNDNLDPKVKEAMLQIEEPGVAVDDVESSFSIVYESLILEEGGAPDYWLDRAQYSMWKLFQFENKLGRTSACIEWGDRHPTDSLPSSGCRFCHLRLDAGGPPYLDHDLDALGLSSDRTLVVSRAQNGLAAVIETPRGRIELT